MIKFEISSQIVEIAPNNVAQVSLTIANTSQIIDFFTVTIEPLISPETMGLYPGWVEFNQPTFSLRPAGDTGRGGDSSQVVIAKINIPPQVYAGNYAGKIIITARSGADNSAEIPFNIVISQIDAQTLEIQPIESTSRKSTEVYRVVVSNQGNAPHIYSVYAEDPNDDLRFIIDPPEVPLRPGEQAALTLKAQPRTRNWVGDEVNHEFKVKMEGSDQEIRGTFKQKAAIAPLHWFGRHWGRFVFFLALLLVLLIVGAIFLLPMLIKPNISAYCAPVSLRNVNVLSNGTTTNILVSGRNGAQPYAVAETEQADKLPGIFASLVTVSPDGRRIAYVTATDLAMNDARIWVKNLDTDQAPIASIPITSGLWPVAPVWSANGEKLAFVVRHPTPIAASGTATVTTPSATGTVTGTATTAASTTAAAATTAAGGTPGADAAANPSQLDLYVVKKIGEDATLLASPQGLVPELFYGNNISTVPLCWASDDASLLVRPQSTDHSQVQVALADGKVQTITPQAGGLQLPKPSLPSLPGLVRPLNSLIGVPASFLQVPQSHFASVQQQTSPGATTGTTTTPKAGTGPVTAGANNGNPTTTPNTANSCSIARPFSQNDPRWADLPLRQGGTSTMAELGCPITGAAILLNYQNVDTNPAELSSCLGNLTSPLNQAGWFAISQQCGGFKLQGGVRADFSWDLLDSALQKGPTIIGLLGGPSGTHFLVVTGGFGGISTSYTVADPWDGTTYKNLDYFLSKGYRPRWVISYEGNGAPCVTGIPDTVNQVGIRTTGAVDGGLYQTPQPFRYEVTGTNDNATATVRIVNPRANLDDHGRTLQPNETQTFSTEGNYTIAIAVKDANGKTVLTRNIYFTIDHTAPVMGARLTPTPDKTTNKSVVPVSITLLATDDLSGIASIEYQVNSSQWQPYTSDTTRVPLTFSDNGTYTINYRATDGAGNTATAETINFAIEKPVIAPTGPGGRPGTGGTSANPQPSPSVNPNAAAGGGAAAGGAGGAKTSAAALAVPTVTPVPTQTPRPAVKNTPTVAPPTTLPATTLAATPTISTTSLLPTGSPAITPTATVPLPTTEIITPTATVALTPILTLPVTTLTFLPDGANQQLQIQNTGNAPLVWNLSPGSSNTIIGFSSTTGNLGVGGNATIDISVLAANLTGIDENTTFTINSNGGSQTVGVIIKSQPLPSATLTLLPVTTSLNFTNTIQVNVTVPNPNVKPNHIDLYATYKNCLNSCVAEPVKIGTYTYDSNTLTAQWGTGNIIPQSGISLSGNLCINPDCSVFEQIAPITDLSISMTAAFAPPSADNTLTASQVLTITDQSDRTKKVNITVLVNDVQTQQFVATAANNWTVTWDTSLISPASPIVIQGEACNTEDDTGVCLPIQPLTGYHTTITGTVDAFPDISAAKSLAGIISFVVTPTDNVKSVTVSGLYSKSLNSTQEDQLAGTTFVKDANNTTFTVPVDTTSWPTQSNISLSLNVCFNQDGTDCLPARTYPGLFIPAGSAAIITDQTEQPKFTTTNTYFLTPLSVKITDIKNNPVEGSQVVFTVPPVTGAAATGSFDGAGATVTVTSGADGVATVPLTNKLKANGIEGTFSIIVTLASDPNIKTEISLNNTSPGAKPMTIIEKTDKQVARIGQKFGSNLQIQLEGAGPGITVTFTSQGTGVGATFAGNATTFTAVTDASGIATAGDLTANPSLMLSTANYPIVGVHSVRASAPGYTPVLFTLTNIVGDPFSISPVITSSADVYDVQAATVGYTSTIDTAYPDIAVQVKDVGGNLLQNTTAQNVQVAFTTSVAPQPGVFFSNSISQTVPTGTGATSNPGVAIATGLKANLKSGPFKVNATVVGFPSVSTNNFNFINLPGSPTSVEINTPVTITMQANTTYSASIQATVYDKGHNTVLDSSGAQVLFASPTITGRSVNDPSSVTFTDTNTANTSYTARVSGGLGIAKVNTPVTATCKVGSFQVVATLVNVAATPSPLDLSITPGNPAQFTDHKYFPGDGNNQHGRIFEALGTPLQTKILDNCGNPLANQPVTFTAPTTTTDPSGNFETVSSGPVSVTVTSNSAGLATAPSFFANSKATRASYTVVATSPDFTGFSQSFTLFNDPGVPKTITPFGVGSASTTPLSVTVGTTYNSDKVVQATVLDAGGNPVFPVIPAGGRLPPADTAITFVGNVASNVDPNTSVGAYFDSAANFTFPDENGVITSTLPLTITNKTGSTYQIKAQAVDTAVSANFNLVNVAGPAANITLSETNFDGSRFQKKVNFICNNSTSCTDREKRAFNEFKVKVTDRFDNVIGGTPVTFNANLGTPVSGGTGSPTANFGALPTTNDNNNRSYSTNTDSLGEITLSPGITDSTSITDTDITASTIVPGFYAGEYTIDVTTTGSTPATATIFMRNLPDSIPNAVSISISTSSGNLGSAANPLTTTVTTAFPQFSAVVRDANGNGIGGKVVTFDMTPASNDITSPSGVWLNPSGSPTLDIQTDSSGNAYINKGVLAPDTAITDTTNLQANKKAGIFNLSASVVGQNSAILSSTIYMKNTAETRIGASSIITFTPPSLAQQQVDQPFGTFNLHLTDQYQNDIGGYPVTFSVPVSVTGTSTGIFSGGSGSSKTISTDASGYAIVPANQLTAGIKAGNFNVTANIPVSLTASTYVSPAPTITLTNLAGPADADHITTSVGSLYQKVTVRTDYGSSILVSIFDKYANPVSSPTVSFTIEPAPSASPTVASADATTPMTPLPDTDIQITGNQATISAVRANTVTGSFTITPHVNGVTSTKPIHFTNAADYPSVVNITAGNNQTPEVGQLFTDTMKVKVFDQYGNTVDQTNPGGGINQVVFTAPTYTAPATGPTAIFTGTDGIASNIYTATVGSNGIAVVEGSAEGTNTGRVRANNQLNTYNINLSVPNLPTGRSVTHADIFTITNLADLRLVSTTRQVKQAGGEAFSALEVRVSGAGGTGVPDLPVTFSILSTQYGAFSASACQKITDTQDNGSVISATVNTGSDGIATINNYCAGTLIGNYVVTATTTIGGFSRSVGVLVANTATFSDTDYNDNQTAPASGGVFNPLGVTVLGYNDATIPGAQVSFGVTDTTYAIIAAPALTTTNSGGLAQANLTAGSYVGSYNVFAALNTPSGILTHTFTLTNSVNVVFTSSPPSLLAGNTSSAGETQTITATVRNAAGKGVQNINIQFSIASADSTKGSFSGKTADFTDKNGDAVVTLQAGGQLGVYTISAVQMSGSKQVGTPATLQATTTAQLSTVSAPTPLAGGASAPISVTVTGFGGGPVPVANAAVKFTIPSESSSMGTVTSSAINTPNTGIAQTGLTTGDVAGSYNVIASLDPAQFSPGPAPVVTTTIPVVNRVNISYDTSVPTLLLAGGTNSGGTPIQGQTAGLVFTATGFGTTPKPISGVNIRVTSDNKNRGTFAGGTVNGNAITATTSPTNNGQATATLIAGGEVGIYNVAAVGMVNNVQISNNSLNIGGTTTASLSVASSLVDIQAGGELVPVSITVTGNSGALVNNAPVLFSSNDTASLSTLPVTSTVNTDASGIAKLDVTSTNKVGFYTLTGNLYLPGVAPLQQPPAQNITIVNTATISTIASATPLAGNTSVPISANVTGYHNNPIVGASVLFTVPTAASSYAYFGTSSSPVPSVTVTTSSASPNVGVASTNVSTRAKAGRYNVQALLDPAQFGGNWNPTTSATIPITNMVTLSISSDPSPADLLAASNSAATNGGVAIVTAIVKGAGSPGVPVSGVTVNFSTDDTTKGNVNNATVLDDGSGTSVTTLLKASNGLGSYNVRAQAFSTDNTSLDVGSGIVSFTAKTSATIATDSVGTATPLAGGATTTYTVKVTGNSSQAVQGASVVFSSSNLSRATVSTAPVSTDSSGNASITLTTGNEAGPYTITANLVGNPTTQTATANFTNTVTIAYDTAPTPLAGGGTDTVVITAKGKNGNIGGVDLTFTGTSGAGNTANGTATGGPTGITGSSTVTVTSNSTGYGAWTLGVTPKIGTTTVSNNGGAYNIPVTNTLLISPTATTTATPPHPVMNGGSGTLSVQVSGFGTYKPSGVPVTFSTIAGTGCGGSACGTITSSASTDPSGVAQATVTSLTGTTPSPTVAQAYDVQATINIGGVPATLPTPTPIHVVNTVKMAQSPGTNLDPSTPMTVTVTDNAGVVLNGFNVQFTVMNTAGTAAGSITTDGYMCLNNPSACDATPTKYLGIRMATVSGKAGVNYSQAVQTVSTTGSDNDADYAVISPAGTTGVSLIRGAGAILPDNFILRAKVLVPGVSKSDVPVIDFNIQATT